MFSSGNSGDKLAAAHAFHECQGSDGPQYGNAATLEAAKQAFRAAWDRRPKASGIR